MHLTGRYPDWWQGKTFDTAVRLWAAGVTGEGTRRSNRRRCPMHASSQLWAAIHHNLKFQTGSSQDDGQLVRHPQIPLRHSACYLIFPSQRHQMSILL
jgi:hypothetical protein